MVIVMVGVLIFWAGWTAFSGARMTMRGRTFGIRFGGAALTLVGVSGLLFAMRLLAS